MGFVTRHWQFQICALRPSSGFGFDLLLLLFFSLFPRACPSTISPHQISIQPNVVWSGGCDNWGCHHPDVVAGRQVRPRRVVRRPIPVILPFHPAMQIFAHHVATEASVAENCLLISICSSSYVYYSLWEVLVRFVVDVVLPALCPFISHGPDPSTIGRILAPVFFFLGDGGEWHLRALARRSVFSFGMLQRR